jgi:hypothetical protein
MSVIVERRVHKYLCFRVKIFKVAIFKEWTCVSECMKKYPGENDSASTVWSRALGGYDILKVLLQTSQVSVYVRITNAINLFLWLMCFLWMPSLPHFFNWF